MPLNNAEPIYIKKNHLENGPENNIMFRATNQLNYFQ